MASTNLTQAKRRSQLKSILSGYLLVTPALLLVVLFIVYPAVLSIIQTLTTKDD
jgi:ABC-type sugar transport system permease subunit